MYRAQLRLVPLALAAFASLATSSIDDEYVLDGHLPLAGETAVVSTVQPRVTLSVIGEGEPPTRWLGLRRAGGEPVAGEVSRAGGSGVYELTFHPAEPLPEGDFELVLDHDGQLQLGEVVGVPLADPFVVPFTVGSRASIRASAFVPDETTALLEFSQHVPPAAVREHVSALDATGDPLPVVDVVLLDPVRHQLRITVPPGTVDLAIADGLLAGDGTPVLGLPYLFSDAD
jgi:hypothetical protein